ncbi:MAG: hypothetical protein L0Z51_00710 [Candidatus Latescibacteria bacterium]|nr:hypothetical protein [Candidatus Latescibacterota bacterium]
MRTIARSLLTGTLLVVATAVLADVTTVTFFAADSPPPAIACGETWTESGVGMRFEPSLDDACAGACTYYRAHNLPGNVVLAPARLVIDAATVAGMVISVEADTQNPCGVGCTLLSVYDNGTLVASTSDVLGGPLETLSVATGGNAITDIVVSSCGVVLHEVRISHEGPLPAANSTWGAVKALYR